MMKKIILPLLLACCASLHAEDCAKNSDACSAGDTRPDAAAAELAPAAELAAAVSTADDRGARPEARLGQGRPEPRAHGPTRSHRVRPRSMPSS